MDGLLAADPIEAPAELVNFDLQEHAASIQAEMDRLNGAAECLANGPKPGKKRWLSSPAPPINGSGDALSILFVIRFHKQLLDLRNPFRLPRKPTKRSIASQSSYSFQGPDMIVRRFGRRNQQEKHVHELAVKARKLNSCLADRHNASSLWHTRVFGMRDRYTMPHSGTAQFLTSQDCFDDTIELVTAQISCVQQSLGQFANNAFSVFCFQFDADRLDANKIGKFHTPSHISQLS
jgi:hypothetical protein